MMIAYSFSLRFFFSSRITKATSIVEASKLNRPLSVCAVQVGSKGEDKDRACGQVGQGWVISHLRLFMLLETTFYPSQPIFCTYTYTYTYSYETACLVIVFDENNYQQYPICIFIFAVLINTIKNKKQPFLTSQLLFNWEKRFSKYPYDFFELS